MRCKKSLIKALPDVDVSVKIIEFVLCGIRVFSLRGYCYACKRNERAE